MGACKLHCCGAPFSLPPVHAAGCTANGRVWAEGSSAPAPLAVSESAPKSRKPHCALGHPHDSKGEAAHCPVVYARAKEDGQLVYRTGSPGVPIFALDPDAVTGRPVYVSADWVLVDATTRKVVVVIDYKGSIAKSKRRDRSWSRGRRALETELGVRVEEIS